MIPFWGLREQPLTHIKNTGLQHFGQWVFIYSHFCSKKWPVGFIYSHFCSKKWPIRKHDFWSDAIFRTNFSKTIVITNVLNEALCSTSSKDLCFSKSGILNRSYGSLKQNLHSVVHQHCPKTYFCNGWRLHSLCMLTYYSWWSSICSFLEVS